MANPNTPFGFRPIGTLNGAAWNSQANLYFIPSSDGSQYNVGDAVKQVVGGDASNGLPTVQKSTGVTTELQRGVIVGVLVVPPIGPVSLVGTSLSLEITNIPATKTKNYYVLVVDDPHTVFMMQDDGSGSTTAATAATYANKNALFTPTNPTSPQQQSLTVLPLSTVATTVGFPLKILGFVQSPFNLFANTFGLWRVMFNQHELAGNQVGV